MLAYLCHVSDRWFVAIDDMDLSVCVVVAKSGFVLRTLTLTCLRECFVGGSGGRCRPRVIRCMCIARWSATVQESSSLLQVNSSAWGATAGSRHPKAGCGRPPLSARVGSPARQDGNQDQITLVQIKRKSRSLRYHRAIACACARSPVLGPRSAKCKPTIDLTVGFPSDSKALC